MSGLVSGPDPDTGERPDDLESQCANTFANIRAIVEAGDPIVLLSNTNLQLEVLGREAAVTEQLNFMRTLELQLEQNRLSHKRNLVEIDYQITRLTRSIQRQSELAEKDLVSQSTLDELQDELEYYRNRRDVTLESQATDARLQEEQLAQLRAASSQLETSLALARKNLDDLNVRAPVAGKLSGFDAEIGESIVRGGRLGQIDDPDGYKLNVRIDEYYLGRVDLEQVATATHNGRELDLVVSKNAHFGEQMGAFKPLMETSKSMERVRDASPNPWRFVRNDFSRKRSYVSRFIYLTA